MLAKRHVGQETDGEEDDGSYESLQTAMCTLTIPAVVPRLDFADRKPIKYIERTTAIDDYVGKHDDTHRSTNHESSTVDGY